MNLLFVCTKNQWRSPTAETLYKCHADYCVRSAGTSQSARHSLSSSDIIWSDIIFVMEYKHKRFIHERFQKVSTGKPIVVLDIPDDYRYMDKELQEWLVDAIDTYLFNFNANFDISKP